MKGLGDRGRGTGNPRLITGFNNDEVVGANPALLERLLSGMAQQANIPINVRGSPPLMSDVVATNVLADGSLNESVFRAGRLSEEKIEHGRRGAGLVDLGGMRLSDHANSSGGSGGGGGGSGSAKGAPSSAGWDALDEKRKSPPSSSSLSSNGGDKPSSGDGFKGPNDAAIDRRYKSEKGGDGDGEGDGDGDSGNGDGEKMKIKQEGKSTDNSGSSSEDEEGNEKYSEGVQVFPVEGGGYYRDYSRANLRSDPVASIFAAASSKDPTFPVKLHQILSSGEFEDVIAWLPHGRAFRVLQPKAFEERVIPLFFRHGRYASFARQVNGWGFHRITNGPDYGSYYHELFLRGRSHLCERMRRPQPGTGPRKSRKEMSSEPSPDFYKISDKAPLPELPPRPDPPTVPGGGHLQHQEFAAAQAAASNLVAAQHAQAQQAAQAAALGAFGVGIGGDAAAAMAAQQQAAMAAGFNPAMMAAAGFGGGGGAAGAGMAGFPGMAFGVNAANPFFIQSFQGMGAPGGGGPGGGRGGPGGGGLAGMDPNMYAAQMMAMGGGAMSMPSHANLLGTAGFFNPAAAVSPPGQDSGNRGSGGGGGSGSGGGMPNASGGGSVGGQNPSAGGGALQWNSNQCAPR